MRYRPMGPSGAIVSVISLNLAPDASRPRPSDWIAFVYAALESGVSAFEVCASDAVIIEGLCQALTAVDRRLVSVAWRLGAASTGGGPPRDISPENLERQVLAALARTGLGYLDAVILEEPRADEVTPDSLDAFNDIRSSGAARLIGLSGDGDAVDELLARGGFDLLVTAFNITSGWRERNRLRAATSRDVAVIGRQPYPRAFHAGVAAAAAKGAKGARGREPLADCGTYAFLDTTHGWTAEEICIAYAITEPSLACVQIEVSSIERLERLAEVPEREMPPGLAAQIEMARFAPAQDGESARRA